jgi:hypothetical protein
VKHWEEGRHLDIRPGHYPRIIAFLGYRRIGQDLECGLSGRSTRSYRSVDRNRPPEELASEWWFPTNASFLDKAVGPRSCPALIRKLIG